MRQTKIVLSDKEIPTKWYNIMADMPNLPSRRFIRPRSSRWDPTT
jgi:predicted alternative tryptophan synthase beta-subunit